MRVPRLLASPCRLVVALATLACAAQAQAPGDVRIALVIGNGAYAGPAALPNPVNDAKAMSDTLRGLGFEVVEVRDASRVQMMEAVQKVRTTLQGKQGIGMLYYAGHGLQLDWRNYMVPVDAKLNAAADVPPQTVEVGTVVDAFKTAGNRMNILVLDACRDNPFPQASSGKGLAQLDAPPGTILAYATAPGNVAEDGTGSNGLYTSFLLQELVKPLSKIEDVFKRTRFAVRKASSGRQIPWESTSLEEDFMFNGGKVAAVPKADTRQRALAFDQEKADWDRIAAGGKLDDFFAFVAKYPSGSFTQLAQVRIEQLQKPAIVTQPPRGEQAQSSFLERYREGDRYEYVFKDGLTGLVTGRGKTVVQRRGDDLFEAVGENMYTTKVNSAGFVYQDGSGSYDPPWASAPGSEFKVGTRLQARSIWTPVRGPKQWVDYETRVVAREVVDTPYGKRNTYKVTIDMVYESGLRRFNTLWFDADWGGAVHQRLEIRRPYPNQSVPEIIVREQVARSRVGQ